MIEYLFGNDTFTGRKIIDTKARSARACVRWVDRDEAEGTPLEYLMDLGKGSLLGNVVVVLRDPSSYSEDVREALLAVSEAPYSGAMILWDTVFDARTSFHKRMKRLRDAQGLYQPRSEEDMVRFTLAYAREQGGDIAAISPQVIYAVVHRTGLDVWAIVQELHKISVLSPDTLARDVESIVPERETSSESAFPLLQAIVSKQKSSAIAILQDMVTGGASEEFILAMLAYQFRLFLAISMGRAVGISMEAVHKKTNLHQHAIAKAAPFASRLSVTAIGDILAKISAAQRSVHTKSMDGQSIVTMLIIGLCR